MKKLNITIILAFIISFAVAQKETYNWHFGNNCSISFNSGAPVFVPGCSIGGGQPIEGTASMSDGNGNVLFYTDGITVWNSSNLPMPNGINLKGNFSTTQSALIVPFPSFPSFYYVFSLNELSDTAHSLYYSVVDMSLNSGMGDVTQKNILVADSMTEKMMAIRHGNGNDYWLVTHKRLTDEFQCYLISSTGISLNPVVSHAGITLTSDKGLGCLKSNRNGTRIAASYWDQLGYFEVYDFNNSTGVVNPTVVFSQSYSRSYSMEFSPNERYIYGTCFNSNTIYQFDLQSPQTPGILIITAQNYTGDLLLAPDGKIYIAIYGADSLAVINQPNMPGAACNYVEGGFYLNGNQCMIGLPNFIHDLITITSLKDVENNNNAVNVYPNPFNDVLKINFQNAANERTTFTIKNVLGQIVFEEKNIDGNTKNVDLGFLSKGIYFLDVSAGDVHTVEKIIKN